MRAQAAHLEEEAARACGEAADLEARCSALGDVAERATCELDRERAGRTCDDARAIEEQLRRRLETAEAAPQPSELHLECRRASEL